MFSIELQFPARDSSINIDAYPELWFFLRLPIEAKTPLNTLTLPMHDPL